MMEASTGEETTDGHNLAVVKQHWETNAMDAKLADGSTMTSLRSMAPFESDGPLTCLGMPVEVASLEGFINHVDLNTEYGKLPRPWKAPSTFPWSLGDFDGAQTEFDWIMTFWNGDFFFEFHCPSAEIFGFCATLDGPNAPTINIQLAFENENWILKEGFSVQITALDERKRNLVAGRVLSQFMRYCGWNLPAPLLLPMMRYLLGVFKGKKKFRKTYLDLCILHADLILNFHGSRGSNSVRMLEPIFGAAEALETLGCFDEASRLYLEGAQYAATSGHSVEADCYASDFYASAGLASKRAGRSHESVEHHLKAIQLSSQGALGWNTIVQQENTNRLLCGLLVLENEVHQELMHARAGTGPYWMNCDEKVFIGIIGLACFAKFEPVFKQVKLSMESFHRPQLEFMVDSFRPEYRQPKKARKALVQIIFRSSTFQDYKEGILGTLSKGILTEIPKDSAVPRPATEKDFKKNVQRYVKARPSQLLSVCLTCGQIEKSLMSCPCGQASYCSKACQKSDGKQHRSGCKWHKAKSSKEG